MSAYSPSDHLRLLTANVHKGYTAFKRRHAPQELREAVRALGSDLVFLQEVEGGAAGTQYEFLAETLWPEHAYGRNAVAGGQDHGNAVLARLPALRSWNHDVSLPGDEPRGLLHCGLHEVFCSGVGQHARSFPARWPLLLLDGIYVRGVVAARPRPMARLPWSRLSDHEPLAAEIDLPGPP